MSKRREYDDDLFKESTMTFGEHLEELRSALFRALIGVAICVCIGIYFGRSVVQLIKDPLEAALKDHYYTVAAIQYKEWADERTKNHQSVPYTIDEVNKVVSQQGMLFDIQWIDPVQVHDQLDRPNGPNEGGPRPLIPNTPAKTPAERKADEKSLIDNPSTGEKQPENTTAEKATPDKAAASPTTSSKGAAPAAASANVIGERLRPVLMWRKAEHDPRVSIKAFNPTEAFSIWLKAAIVCGLVIAAPWVFWQLWMFVAAGLYPHEKRYIYIFLPFSLALFVLGVVLAYEFVFGPVLGFLFKYNREMGLDIDPRITEWLSFVLFLPLGFGIAFQLPLVMLFMERIGIFTVKTYLSKWRLAVLVITVLSGVLTPADPYSIFLLMIPLILLYFGGILLCKFMPRTRSPFDESELLEGASK